MRYLFVSDVVSNWHFVVELSVNRSPGDRFRSHLETAGELSFSYIFKILISRLCLLQHPVYQDFRC